MADPRAFASKSTNGGSAEWPGKRLGLPKSGARSIALLGRRFAAIAIDWALAYLIGLGFFRTAQGSPDGFAVLLTFAILQYLFITLISGSIGHLLLGMRVVPLKHGWIGFCRPALRTVLLCLAIPALMSDLDRRGLHDRLAGTVLVRR